MSKTLQRYNPEPTCIQSNSTTMSGVALRQHSEGIVVLHVDAQRRIEELEGVLEAVLRLPLAGTWFKATQQEREAVYVKIRAALRK